MSKRMAVAIIGIVAMILMPTMRAEAGVGDSAVVAVFTGSATVDPGLCLPLDLAEDLGCESGGATAGYELIVPGDETDNVPDVCIAAGVFELEEVVPDGLNNNCGLVAHGTVTGSAPGLDPSCGLSHGESDNRENTVELNGVERGTTNGWITSAGGTIPVTGTVDGDGDQFGDHTLAALVQARPLTEGGAIACVETRAQNFIIVGVAVVL